MASNLNQKHGQPNLGADVVNFDQFILKELSNEILPASSIYLLNYSVMLHFSMLEERMRHHLLFLEKGYWYPKHESDKPYFNGDKFNNRRLSGLGQVLDQIAKHEEVKNHTKSEVILEHLRLINKARNSLLHSFAYINLYHHSNLGRETYEKDKIDFTKLVKSMKSLYEFYAVLKAVGKVDILFCLTGKKHKDLQVENNEKAKADFAFSNDLKYSDDDRFFTLLDKLNKSIGEFKDKYTADKDFIRT